MMALELPKELNTEIFEKVLRDIVKNETISIIHKIVTKATEPGDNYSSDMYRINFEYTCNKNNEKVTEKKSLIIKAALTSEGDQKNIVEKLGVFVREIQMMMSTLKEMQLLLFNTKLCGECYYARQEKPEFLIIEDLGTLGFRVSNQQKGLDLQHCLLVMKGLGKFHGSSIAVCEKNSDEKYKYSESIYSMKSPVEFKFMVNSSLKQLGEVLKTWPEINKLWSEKMLKFSENAFEKIAMLRQPDDSELNVINHGDCWINNLLFIYDSENKPVAQAFVDFQCCAYGSPAIDLHNFLHTSPSEEVSINHTDKLINEYYNNLCETMNELNCKTKIPTMNDLKKYIKKFELYGLFNASFNLAMTLQNRRERSNANELMNAMYEGIDYRKAMSRRLIYWSENGLLDDL